MSKTPYDLVVIGAGVASQAMLWELSGDSRTSGWRILQLHFPDWRPALPSGGVALVAPTGMAAPSTFLGRLIDEAFQHFSRRVVAATSCPAAAGIEEIDYFKMADPAPHSHQGLGEYQRRYGALEYIEQLGPWKSFQLPGQSQSAGGIWGKRLRAYLVGMEPFFQWIGRELARPPWELTSRKALVSAWDFLPAGEGLELQLDSGEKVRSKRVLMATGAYSRWILPGLDPFSSSPSPSILSSPSTQQEQKQEQKQKQEQGAVGASFHLKRSKVVTGSYLQWPMRLERPASEGRIRTGAGAETMAGAEAKQEQLSAALSVDSTNLIYSALTQTLYLGAANSSEAVLAPDYAQLKACYQRYQAIGGPGLLPPFSAAQVQRGARHKGASRRPFWGELELVEEGGEKQGGKRQKERGSGLFGLWGLYKNGVMYSFLGAARLKESLISV